MKIEKIGYGQVEPNHLSAQRTAQIYAQLPADEKIEVLENGTFVNYNYAAGKVELKGEFLVMNEVKLYDGLRQTYKDFAMKAADSVDGKIYPRVLKTNIGDIFTTNMVKAEVEVGTKLTPNAEGILDVVSNETENIWQVAKIYTLADGQAAIKVQRIK